MHGERRSAGLVIAGEVVGGMQHGKAFALSEWRFRKEKAEFKVLVNRLRARKWAKDHRARANKRSREWAKTRKGAEWTRAYRRERRRKRLAATIYTCRSCGSTWCKAPWVRGPAPSFCGDRCYQRHRYQTNAEAREKAKANARAQHRKTKARAAA